MNLDNQTENRTIGSELRRNMICEINFSNKDLRKVSYPTLQFQALRFIDFYLLIRRFSNNKVIRSHIVPPNYGTPWKGEPIIKQSKSIRNEING